MLKIPDNVPKHLVEELEAYQKQLRILFSNYQILKKRKDANPEDALIPEQIKQVEKYILQFNSKQMPVIQQIRDHLKSQENGHNGSKSSDEELVKNDEERPVSEEEILESLGLKNVARTNDGKIDHGKLSMKDRMAIVRGMRKRRKKSTANEHAKKNEESINVEDNSDSNNEASISSSSEAAPETVSESQYNGYVIDSEKYEAKPPIFDDSECNEIKKRKPEAFNERCSQLQFLANLDLFTPKEVDVVQDLVLEAAKKKLNYRNMTYIPEMSDKKHKISYTYLAPDINSPPLLRTRQRRQVNHSNTASRMTSRSNSRATTPDRAMIRQISSVSSNDSSESTSLGAPKKSEPEKAALENELETLKKRYDELQTILAANKRTISTRKERSRLTEVSDEAAQLDTRMIQIKKLIAKL